MTLRSSHVVPSINHEGSGTSYAVPRLCGALADAHVDVSLHVLARGVPPRWDGPAVHQYPEWGGPFLRLGVSPSMRRALRLQTRGAPTIVHSHGLWLMPNVYSAYAVENTHSHLVTSPHGAFDPWAWKNSRWRKRLMWTLLQRRAVERAECLVVTSESERRGIRSLGLRAPIAVIPLGVDVPPLLSAVVTPSSRRLVFFGRLHAKKGIDVLLRAWAGVSPRFPDWELHVIGPDDRGYAAEMQVLATTLRVQRVVFRGPIYGEQKWRELAAARLFVLPTHAENFGLAVAEALASGVPAIVTKGAPWEGLERERCGRWIEHGEDALVACLDDCLGRDPEELRAMGQRGRRWIEREFSWSLVSENTVKVYSWLIDGGATPACVRMD